MEKNLKIDTLIFGNSIARIEKLSRTTMHINMGGVIQKTSKPPSLENASVGEYYKISTGSNTNARGFAYKKLFAELIDNVDDTQLHAWGLALATYQEKMKRYHAMKPAIDFIYKSSIGHAKGIVKVVEVMLGLIKLNFAGTATWLYLPKGMNDVKVGEFWTITKTPYKAKDGTMSNKFSGVKLESNSVVIIRKVDD